MKAFPILSVVLILALAMSLVLSAGCASGGSSANKQMATLMAELQYMQQSRSAPLIDVSGSETQPAIVYLRGLNVKVAAPLQPLPRKPAPPPHPAWKVADTAVKALATYGIVRELYDARGDTFNIGGQAAQAPAAEVLP
jgi:hypothetical protein